MNAYCIYQLTELLFILKIINVTCLSGYIYWRSYPGLGVSYFFIVDWYSGTYGEIDTVQNVSDPVI